MDRLDEIAMNIQKRRLPDRLGIGSIGDKDDTKVLSLLKCAASLGRLICIIG